MAYKYKCNKCNTINVFNNDKEELICKCCNSIIDKDICNHEVKNEKYYIHEIQIALMNEDYSLIMHLIQTLKRIDENNVYVKIYSSQDKLKEWARYSYITFDLDLIFRYDLLKTVEKEDLIEVINESNIDKKEQYLDKINNCDEEDLNILAKINNIDAEYYISKKEKMRVNSLPLLMGIFSLSYIIIMLIICNTIIPNDCNYACIVLLDIIPSIVLTIAVLKIIKLEKAYIGIPLFIAIYLITSFIFTINMHPAGFIESINYHFERIIYSFSDIARSINSNLEPLPGEVEAGK